MRTFSNHSEASRLFYTFSGFHSFLIGLFPFFIPVYLWKNNFSLNDIALLIAITGLSFCLTLRLWESSFSTISLQKIILLSFGLEILLLSTFFVHEKCLFIMAAGTVNGMYSCLFWICQRNLFIETITTRNTGRKFGNFQIFVFFLLKMGIFTGGLLLDNLPFIVLYLVTIAFNLLAIFYFLSTKTKSAQGGAFPKNYRPMSTRDILCWGDASGSKTAFALDGIFLYLESYYWALSLFLIAKENFRNMALLVILLAVSFGLIFYIIKNNIDKMNQRWIYNLAVFLYLLSWLLRDAITQVQEVQVLTGASLGVTLVMITFFTGFFRLAFNKRFFEHAKQGNSQQYILLKSYYSQFFIALFFVLFSKIYESGVNLEVLLQKTYWPAALMTLFYLRYSQYQQGAKQTLKET